MKYRYLFDNPRNVKILLWLVFVLCGGLFALDVFHHRHSTHPWEDRIGFYAGYGFAAYVILVYIAKGLRRLVKRDETYYGDD